MSKINVTRTKKNDEENPSEEEVLVSSKLEEIRREVWWVSTFLVKVPLILGGLYLLWLIVSYFSNQAVLKKVEVNRLTIEQLVVGKRND